MFAIRMTPEWIVWIATLSAPLHGRLDWRLTTVVAGILFASGRRTVSSWWRAARVSSDFSSYYYFLDSVGRKTTQVAARLLGRTTWFATPSGPMLSCRSEFRAFVRSMRNFGEDREDG